MGESVHCQDGAWYFYDEVWVDRYGPFETEEEARDELLNVFGLDRMMRPRKIN